MDVSKVSAGKNPPVSVNVVIEVPMGALPVKYEMDKESGAMLVDRFLATPMFYPCNYGFIPQSLSGDGDPADVLVVCPYPLISGSVIAVRPVGVLLMEDEGGQDEKIIAVPVPKLTPLYNDVKSYEDLPKSLIAQIQHFFEHYKDLEDGKWVKVVGFADAKKAESLISQAIANYKG